MAKSLIILPETEQDITEAYDWYQERELGLGEEFLRCVDASIQTIARNPEIVNPDVFKHNKKPTYPFSKKVDEGIKYIGIYDIK